MGLTLICLALSGALATGVSVLVPQYMINENRMMTALSFFAITLLARLTYAVYLYPRFFTPFKNLPQMNLIGKYMNRRDIEASFVKFVGSSNHDGLLRSYMPHAREMLIMTSPKALADILVHKPYHFVKPDHIKFDLNYLFAKGLFTAEGAEHKALRKNLAPAFSFRHIKGLYPIFWSKSLEMVDAITNHLNANPADDGIVKMHDWTTRATLDIIGVAGMGFDFGSLHDPENRIHQEYKRITTFSRRPSLFLGIVRAFGFETLYQLGLKMYAKDRRIHAEAMETVRGVATQMVRKEMSLEDKKSQSSHNIVSTAARSGVFSEEDLVDEVMTFIGAGHESTSAAMLWGVYALCKHPEVQNFLREEMQASHGSAAVSSTDDAEKIHSLPYLNAFVNEVLRFYPSVPVTLRRSVCDTTIDDIFIPADTALALPIRAINHDVRQWGPDANEFNPARWLQPGMANSGGSKNNYANMTFLHGPRSCIGLSFARSELVFLMASLVQAFKLELEDPGQEPDCELQITILPKDGLRVRLSPAKLQHGT